MTHRFSGRLGRAALFALIGCGFAASAIAQNFQWRADTFNDPSNKGKHTAFLTQGVPETDDLAFRASCEPGSSATFAPTVFVYNTGRLPRNQEVSVSFFVNGQRVHRMPGLVYHPDSEEGIAGIMVRADVDDALWSVLSRHSYVHYEADGMGKAGMNLAGSSLAIGRFLEDCRAIFNIGGGAASSQPTQQPAQGGEPPRHLDDRDNPENDVAEADSCRKFGRVKSRNTGQAVSIRFSNRTSSYRMVMWLDYDGRPVEYKALNPGDSYVQQTFVGHPWMVTDGPGNCKEIFVPKRGSREFTMTFDR